MQWLTKIFGPPEEINGGERCPTYLFRWTIARIAGRAIYLHHFVGDDWSLDPHDHPKRFISIGLSGMYREEVWRREEESPGVFKIRKFATGFYFAPWIRTFPADYIHRISMIDKSEAWTLVIVLKSVRPWGFWVDQQWVEFKEYIRSSRADAAKACE